MVTLVLKMTGVDKDETDDPGVDSDDDDNDFNVDNIVSGADDDGGEDSGVEYDDNMMTFVLMLTLVMTMMIDLCWL